MADRGRPRQDTDDEGVEAHTRRDLRTRESVTRRDSRVQRALFRILLESLPLFDSVFLLMQARIIALVDAHLRTLEDEMIGAYFREEHTPMIDDGRSDQEVRSVEMCRLTTVGILLLALAPDIHARLCVKSNGR
jgi:hypothetical protein